MNIISIDYSINSPAIAISTDGHYQLIGFSKTPSNLDLPNHTLKILPKPDNFNTYNVPKLLYELIKPYLTIDTKLVLEDYSYDSFKRYPLIESTGILKYLLHPHSELTTIAPRQWKHAYLGKGTADKFDSIQKLSECLELDLLEYYKLKHLKHPPKPLQDIADAFGILKAYEKLKEV